MMLKRISRSDDNRNKINTANNEVNNSKSVRKSKRHQHHHDRSRQKMSQPMTLRGKKIFKCLIGGIVVFLILGYSTHTHYNQESNKIFPSNTDTYNKVTNSAGEHSDHNKNPTNVRTTIEDTSTSEKLGEKWIQGDLDTDAMKKTLENQMPQKNNRKSSIKNQTPKSVDDKTYSALTDSEKLTSFDRCNFRTYMSHRFYGLHKPFSTQPPFLTNEATYIRGKWPFVLHNNLDDYQKICIDQAEWDNDHPERWPFGDGQNPSIVSLAANPYNHSGQEDKKMKLPRLDYNQNAKALVSFLRNHNNVVEGLFLGITVFGNAKCAWNMTKTNLDEYNYSPLDMERKPIDQSMILVMNEQMKTMHQTTLLLEQDADWGTNKRKRIPMSKDNESEGKFKRASQQFDDPRLFFHQGNVYVLYRNGPKFGYDQQVQNPVHFEIEGEGTNEESIIAYIKASESFTVCCGRNIALLSEEFENDDSEVNDHDNDLTSADVKQQQLKALVWIDPVTVASVNQNVDKNRRRLLSLDQQELQQRNNINHSLPSHRQLRALSKQKKSDIHGTNGYMVPLHNTKEYLGIAHFHRPENRQESDYALHGHHYTHAFFTIGKEKASKTQFDETTATNSEQKYVLKRISNEFMFPTQSMSTLQGDPDGDIIQFASGIDLIGSDVNGKILISYGINDCEGATLTIDVQEVQSMLLEMDGNENGVIDLMKPIDLLTSFT